MEPTIAFERLRALSRSGPPLDIAARKDLLRKLRALVSGQEGEFAAAISADFGQRSRRETAMCEILPSLQAIDDALKNAARWARAQRRRTALHFWPATNRVVYQPKGVVLIIVPWNYPLQLTIGPLAGALAAGNRVIVKPSELTPKFSEVLKRRLEAALGTDVVHVAPGGVEVATSLTSLPFDHILFTGSTAVGAKVMEAAARNLTPVTLELGGKSPAIVHETADLDLAARRIARGKLMNAGQTCIAPDYVLVPSALAAEFAGKYRAAAAALYPRIVQNPDYTSIISARHYDRLAALVAEARAGGAEVTIIDPAQELAPGEAGSANQRRFAPVIVTGVRENMRLMSEEIFGPVLPVVTYETLDAAIAFVNSRPRPLALYYFDGSSARIPSVIESTVAGGVTINDTILHVAQEDLPFGGIGPSGMGAYHGEAGFRTFSHEKGVMHQATRAPSEMLAPPYGRRFDTITGLLKRWLA